MTNTALRISILGVGLLLFGATTGVFFQNHTLPNQKIGKLSVGLLTKKQLEEKLNSWIIGTPVTVQLPDRSIVTTYANLNVAFDFSSSPPRLMLTHTPVIIPLNPEVATTITYNPETKQFVTTPETAEEVLDADSLLSQAIAQFGSKQPMLAPQSFRREHRDEQVVRLNTRLINAFADGIEVKVKNGKEYTTINLSPAQVLNLLSVTQAADNPQLEVNSHKLANTVLSQLSPKEQADFQTPTAVQNTVALLNERFKEASDKTAVLGIDDGPSSDGSLASRYIEVDLSQQKLYLFLKGSVYKSYPASTGSEYPTPPGEYHILNKAPLAFSNIYNAWMPYWMGFSYQNDVGAYLGVHEIAYQEGEKGEKVYRYGNYIGDRKTGGCVALEPKAAEEVYNLSTVGMLVRVVE